MFDVTTRQLTIWSFLTSQRDLYQMDVPKASEQAPAPFLFSSEAGHAQCQCILKELLLYEPHDVQIESVFQTFDKIDFFAILPTSSGKTSFLSMYMLVVLAIQKDPSLCPTAKFPRNPCLLAICPTKYLEHQMVHI